LASLNPEAAAPVTLLRRFGDWVPGLVSSASSESDMAGEEGFVEAGEIKSEIRLLLKVEEVRGDAERVLLELEGWKFRAAAFKPDPVAPSAL